MEAEQSSVEPSAKAENLECQHGRTKKRRRGKKKRSKNQDDFELTTQNDEKESTTVREGKRKHKKVIIRPVDVPKAPLNYTQFIMDDHDECHLYFSFEKPDPHQPVSSVSAEKNGIVETEVEGDGTNDIDYEYQPLQDLDNSAYYLQDFEDSYFNMRCDELLRLSKDELISAVENLETQLNGLENRLYEQDPGSALEQLQQKLLLLQEENVVLHTSNEHLKDLFEKDSLKELSENANNLESNAHPLEVLPVDEELSGDSSDDSYDCSECNDNSNIQSNDEDECYHSNVVREFEHVAIEPSSDECTSPDRKSAENESVISCENSLQGSISVEKIELIEDSSNHSN